RVRRFSVALECNGEVVWAHSNNSGSMLGLTKKGMPVLASAANKAWRKLKFTQEAVLVAEDNWVGVNTGVPNRMLQAAYEKGQLSFARGYQKLKREAKFGASRLDAHFYGGVAPSLWVECKNVTLVEDGIAYFPDAASERGRKHLKTLMDIVQLGERAGMFYLVQRMDAKCFAPCDVIDLEYARLFWKALDMGVEVYVYLAKVDPTGISFAHQIPVITDRFEL
ncbi:MAG: DNA/RNA nuclease SfsA, partial [Desulfovibrio sp.]|nr:DNA/RNA nuclease SfsA [Desulfovibrio sp.]